MTFRSAPPHRKSRKVRPKSKSKKKPRTVGSLLAPTDQYPEQATQRTAKRRGK